jgi:hypothetical protein
MVGPTVVDTGKQIWATLISHHLQCCCLGIAHIFGKQAVTYTLNLEIYFYYLYALFHILKAQTKFLKIFLKSGDR